MTQAYPLHWPEAYPRTRTRAYAPFKVSPGQAKSEMYAELTRIGARDVVVSTNQRMNRDGTASLSGRVDDPGVAVYFKRKGRDVVLACDKYNLLHDNMRAIGKTIEAMRGIERWGASDMLDRAFTGFELLPAPEQWWQVLGLPGPTRSRDEITAAFRRLAPAAHPDSGGSDAAMARLNTARDTGVAVLTL